MEILSDISELGWQLKLTRRTIFIDFNRQHSTFSLLKSTLYLCAYNIHTHTHRPVCSFSMQVLFN